MREIASQCVTTTFFFNQKGLVFIDFRSFCVHFICFLVCVVQYFPLIYFGKALLVT